MWPWASALVRDGTVAATLRRLEAKGLVRGDGSARYVKLPHRQLLLQNESGPTPLAVQLSHFLSVFDPGGDCNDLKIVIYDIGQDEWIKICRQCAHVLGYNAGAMVGKPLASLRLVEFGQAVATSPLAEDFVSFREARLATGLRNM